MVRRSAATGYWAVGEVSRSEAMRDQWRTLAPIFVLLAVATLGLVGDSRTASSLASSAAGAAERGQLAVNDLVERMDRLSSGSARIAEIVGVFKLEGSDSESAVE